MRAELKGPLRRGEGGSLRWGQCLTLSLVVSASIWAEVRAEEEGASSAERALTQRSTRSPIAVSASYLSARLTPPSARSSGYLSDDALSLGVSASVWGQGPLSLGVGVGAQVWREALQLTPSAMELRPMTPVEGDGQPLYPMLSRPDQVTRDEVVSGLGVMSFSSELRSSSALWPSLSVHLGAQWLASNGYAQGAQGAGLGSLFALGGELSGWVSGRLRWQAEGRLWSPWLYGRWAGVSLGTELHEERSAVSLRGHELTGGLSVGRATLSVSWLDRGAQAGYGAGLTLPLSAPLYLCSSAWLSGGAESERAFTVGLRWTGETELMERPPANPSGGSSGGSPSAPSGPQPHLGSPSRSGAPLSPLSPRSPGANPGPGQSPINPL